MRWGVTDTRFALVLFVLALLPRLYVAIAWAREPVWDGHYYHFGATRIAQGLGYSEDVKIAGELVWKPWCHYPVGYSGLVGLVYKVFGTGLWVAPVLNALIGSLTAAVVFALARYCLGPWRARIAGLLCAFHPGLVLYTALVMTEPLSALTLALSALGAVWACGRKLGPILSGVTLGLGALVRPTALLGAPWLLLVWKGPWLRRLLWTALAGAMALVVIAPWTIRNCRVMDECTLLSSNGGWNLAIGAVTDTGRFAPLSAKLGCPGPGQVQQDRCWRNVGVQRIKEDPWHWIGLMPLKLKQTYNHESFAVGYLAEADPKTWPDERKWLGQRVLTLFHHLLMFAAVLGAVSLTWRPKAITAARFEVAVQTTLLLVLTGYGLWAAKQVDAPLYWLIALAPLIALTPLPGAPRLTRGHIYLWGLVLMTSVTHAVFFGEDRYHLTISPLLCLLAAGALRPPARRDTAAVID